MLERIGFSKHFKLRSQPCLKQKKWCFVFLLFFSIFP